MSYRPRDSNTALAVSIMRCDSSLHFPRPSHKFRYCCINCSLVRLSIVLQLSVQRKHQQWWASSLVLCYFKNRLGLCSLNCLCSLNYQELNAVLFQGFQRGNILYHSCCTSLTLCYFLSGSYCLCTISYETTQNIKKKISLPLLFLYPILTLIL